MQGQVVRSASSLSNKNNWMLQPTIMNSPCAESATLLMAGSMHPRSQVSLATAASTGVGKAVACRVAAVVGISI